MTVGMIGKKCGSTRIYQEDGKSMPVTVLYFEENIISQIKTQDADGYSALQLGAGAVKKMNKPKLGHFNKNSLEPKKYLPVGRRNNKNHLQPKQS